MKKTMFVLAVFAVLVAAIGAPAWAGSVITNQATVGSAAFGFEPSQANLETFTNRNTGTNFVGGVNASFTAAASTPFGGCVGSDATGWSCTITGGNGYIPRAGEMPGAYTSRPDRVVTANPDWACGTNVVTGGNCASDNGVNLSDRVLGNDTTASGANTAPGTGTNDGVATSCGIVVGGCVADGTLVGTYTSVVNFEDIDGTAEGGMPTGTITFTRTPNANTLCRSLSTNSPIFGQGNCSDVTLSQSQSQVITGLYTFAHSDTTDAPFSAIDKRSYGNATGLVGATANVPRVLIRSVTSLTQDAMGGDAESTGGSDTQIWGTLWTNQGGHPGNNFFTPGLNNQNSAIDNSTFLSTPANPVDGNGFRQ